MTETAIEVSPCKATLCLTLNRTSQQAGGNKQNNRRLLKDRKFTMYKSPPYFCKKYGAAILSFKSGTCTSVTFLKMLCNSWRCPNCAPIKARSIAELIRGIIILNNMTHFLTLTLDPKVIPDSYGNRTQKYITDIFNTLLTNVKRDLINDQPLKYVWVVEFQRLNTDNAHLHIVLNQRLDIIKVREIWKRIGGGVQMYIKPIKNLLSVSSYISKYLIKNVENSTSNLMYHYEKRYSISRSCIRPKSSVEPYCPKLDNFEKKLVLQKNNLDWVYNTLVDNTFIDGETITAPDSCLPATDEPIQSKLTELEASRVAD